MGFQYDGLIHSCLNSYLAPVHCSHNRLNNYFKVDFIKLVPCCNSFNGSSQPLGKNTKNQNQNQTNKTLIQFIGPCMTWPLPFFSISLGLLSLHLLLTLFWQYLSGTSNGFLPQDLFTCYFHYREALPLPYPISLVTLL